eukprot:gene1469-2828_t
METILNMRPSSYSWMYPPTSQLQDMDRLASEGKFPILSHLAPSILYAIGFCIIRYVLKIALVKPMAIYLLQINVVQLENIENIDSSSVVRKSKKLKLNAQQIDELSATTGISKEDINSYLWKKRRQSQQNKKITKFEEAFWRFLLYASFLIVGYQTLFTPTIAPWVTDARYFYLEWPFQPIHEASRFYYFIELGAYLHLLMYTEIHRSDALEMGIHHLLTILLIIFSYISNFTRIGTVILILHDSADIFLESAKCFNYYSKVKGHEHTSIICDILFAMFAITFFITRLILYPRVILYGIMVVGPSILSPNFPGYVMWLGLLTGLQCLHIFWFYLIARMIIKLFAIGTVEKDIRSDDEDEDEPKKKD